MQSEPIERHSLADAASERLRSWILDGSLSQADDLTEPALAQRLGISRTPLRAAISRLQHEGLIEIRPGRGFRIAPVNATLVREIYPVLAALESMALRLSSPNALPDPAALRRINDQIAPGLSRRRLLELDRSLHERLSAGCPNARVLTLLEQHRALARRVDGATRRGMHKPAESRREHAAIIADIAAGRIDSACHRIEQHYLNGIEVVLDWMKSQKED